MSLTEHLIRFDEVRLCANISARLFICVYQHGAFQILFSSHHPTDYVIQGSEVFIYLCLER